MNWSFATAAVSVLAVLPVGVGLLTAFVARPHWLTASLLLAGPLATAIASVFTLRRRHRAPAAGVVGLTVTVAALVLTAPLLDGGTRDLAMTCCQGAALFAGLVLNLALLGGAA